MLIKNIVRNFTNNLMGLQMIKSNNNVKEQEIIARFAKAMGHPTRVAILLFLASQESCFFGDIHDELPIAKATVSQHLKELKEAGLIQGEIETPKVRYCINKENWEIASKLFADLFSVYATKDICC
ncbi:DNA-binding transcriptional regulator, ArsR family [Porphyromonadaceae bacterium KH3CP3RA]|nr:DNA-binding transcriptional regulator, ArsR family [Porphyromonadaceae bacterium KH3CP3RA]